MNYADAIQNELVNRAKAFDFLVYRYIPSATGAQRITDGSTVKPAAVIAFPDATIFGEAVNHRRTSRRREVVGASWRLQLQFNQAVSLEEFEASLLTTFPRIARNPAESLDQQVDLLLEEAEYQNPVTQQPAQGTRVTYRFTAQFTPT